MSDMYDEAVSISERIIRIKEIIERIPMRCANIKNPEDFTANMAGIDMMDAICMVLIAAGEEIKKIDRRTNGELLAKYPEIEWRDIIGVRNVLAHGYMDIDAVQLFNICRDDIPRLIKTLENMIAEQSAGS